MEIMVFADLAAIGLLVALIGLSDFRRRSVPDVYTSALWMVFSPFAIVVPYIGGLTIFAFAWLFFANALWVRFKRPEPPLAWGDILATPPVVGMVGLFSWTSPWPAILFAVPLGAMFIAPHFNKDKRQPMMAYVAIGYFFSLFLWLILHLRTA